MNIRYFAGMALLGVLGVFGCKSTKGKFEFIHPESGTRVAFGEVVTLKLNIPFNSIDSVVYSVDGEVIARKTDTTSVQLDTKNYGFGDRSLSAKVYAEGKEDIAYSNIVVLPGAAKNYGFEVVNRYPHDTKAYTQGLQYADGVLYETTGQPSMLDGIVTSLRKVNLNTGEIIKIEQPNEDFFGEGMTIVGDKIVFLTWEHNKGFFYDKNTFKKIGSFEYGNSREGWGLTYDGSRLIKSDGSNKLYFLNAQTGKEEGFIGVYDENGPVANLNELEYIEGKVYANVYGQDIIVIINPQNGMVEGRINLVGLYTEAEGRKQTDNELNGIAYDAKGKRLFVTGKLWPQLFEIKLIER
ncbi:MULTISPECIES: glutaminyl-peptide cyclotransferase [Sphingobacterium]|uniref:Glutamine cyclotransferase n=1 Tax=Sphingobacterium thermophilum TaxID=768534 RepID=A0ABP8R1C3_9SPHI|nr:glutaminyl-peptide cyclotransferase [Sphingobacterium sp. T2]